MADTTPISNVLNLNLAIRMNDAIAPSGDNGTDADTDGKIMLDTSRNKYIINASRWLVDKIVGKVGVEKAIPLLQGCVTSQSMTLSSTGVTLNKDYMYPVRLLQSSTIEFEYVDAIADAVIDLFPYKDYVYTISGGKLYAWIRTSGTLTLQNSGSATFYYIGAPRVNSSTGADVAINTAPDLGFDQKFLNAITAYAEFLACSDKGTTYWLNKGQLALTEANNHLGF